MINVCYRCGIYRADKTIDLTGPYAICPECGFRHPFRMLPLLIVTGASGAGKSSVLKVLSGTLDQVVLLETDILWRPEFDQPQENYRDYFETWLRLSKNISQAGRPVVLFGAGIGVPANIENCIERRYFSTVHYLALVCDNQELERRLRARPEWRKSSGIQFIESQISFNRWFKQESGRLERLTMVDTTAIPLDQTAHAVVEWINRSITRQYLRLNLPEA
jgi:hypothetical protein